jgi:hypothetical protein
MHAFFWGAGMVTSLVPRDIEPLTILESIITVMGARPPIALAS